MKSQQHTEKTSHDMMQDTPLHSTWQQEGWNHDPVLRRAGKSPRIKHTNLVNITQLCKLSTQHQ
jgi:hypothetical protein